MAGHTVVRLSLSERPRLASRSKRRRTIGSMRVADEAREIAVDLDAPLLWRPRDLLGMIFARLGEVL